MRSWSSILLGCCLALSCHAAPVESGLKGWYEACCSQYSDIYEHVPVLKELAKECSSVVEIGVRSMVSTSGILYGLSLSKADAPYYLGIDLVLPPQNIYNAAKRFAKNSGVEFHFALANDMDMDIDPVDMLFIDSLHTYAHLTYELEKFSPKVKKYIAMHDTSPPWGYQDDSSYHGDYAEYPAHINRVKKGLWPAVTDFLSTHPEWTLLERKENNHGFTVLKRMEP
ncbi:MAG: Paramecium bursaria Chlorella virus [Chlamydiota bacterium]|jgi:hypothetical protein